MSEVWGGKTTDYIAKRESVCARCRQQRSICDFWYLCVVDIDIKFDYKHGSTKNAIALLRGLPSELLKDYLSEKRRTPADLKAVILDELQIRNETETIMRL